jgi:hypothetical protein
LRLRGDLLAAEVWQFLIVILGFFAAILLWLFVIYLPGRTLEHWEDQRSGRADREGDISGTSG